MNDAQIRAKIREGKPGKYAVDRGLYLRVSEEGTGFWVVRYTANGKRHEISIGRYGKPPEGTHLTDALFAAAQLRANLKKGIDPIAERKRSDLNNLKTVDDLAEYWLKDCSKRLKHPDIPRRVYEKDIRPMIGNLAIDRVNARDIRGITRNITDSGRPTISNDALSYCKQMFNQAIKLDLIQYNPAIAFNNGDAGGTESSRERALNLDEIKLVFEVFRKNHAQFTRENYLASCILLCLGVRKSELLEAQWQEINLHDGLWQIPRERSKNSQAITIPLPPRIVECFQELQVRAFNSEYVFPNRRASKRHNHVSPDTLNAAITKLFRQNKLDVAHFQVHDLRRTFRTLLAAQGVSSHIAERCLNHQLPKIERIYNGHDYLEERREALNKILSVTEPLLWPALQSPLA